MRLYFAPMEGVTDAIFRSVHHSCFGGVDQYFIPFISPTQNLVLTPRERAELSPAVNQGMNAVPQIMTKHAEHFLWAASAAADLGYHEVNLNMGCPSGTVTGKGKGSGLLRNLDSLKFLLDEIFTHCPISVSLKTRIGYLSEDEWPALLEVLKQYPASEIVIHPRTRKQFYKGIPFRDAYTPAFERLHQPIILNGDLFTPADIQALLHLYPNASGVMLGRGLIGNPALADEVKGGQKLDRSALVHFHNMLVERYLAEGNDVLALVRMRMVTYYMCSCFADPHKPWKMIRKARTLDEYMEGVKMLFEEREMLPNPYYTPLND